MVVPEFATHNCTIAGIPGTCWPHPVLLTLQPFSADVDATYPGMRGAGSSHLVFLEVSDALRIEVRITSQRLGDCPTDVLDEEGTGHASLIRDASGQFVIFEDGRGATEPGESAFATLVPGRYRLRVESGSANLGRYTVHLRFGQPQR